jgi:WD40 repeat protein
MRPYALLPLLAFFAVPAVASSPACGVTPLTAPDAHDLNGDAYVRVAPDGTASWVLASTRFAAFAPSHTAWVRETSDGLPALLCVDGAVAAVTVNTTSLAWSPDGTRLAYTSDGTVRVLGGASMPGTSFVWSPSSDTLLVADATTVTVRALDGTVTTTLETAAAATGLAWQGTTVAYKTDDFTVVTVTSGTRHVIPSGFRSFALSPDGTRIAVGYGSLMTYDADGTNATTLGDDPQDVAWSPDSTTLAVARLSGGSTATGGVETPVLTGAAERTGWATATTPWFTTVDLASGSHDLVVDGTVVAHARPGHALWLARTNSDGSYVVAVQALRTNGLPRVG